MDVRALVLIALLGFVLQAVSCVAPTRYYWGDYEDRLLAAYENPQEEAAFTTHLRYIIDEATENDKRVPPGIYAEYGYSLYRAGDIESAAIYFQHEADVWPESSTLMLRLIDRMKHLSKEDDVSGNVDSNHETGQLAPDESSGSISDAEGDPR
jgi:hypothetical protein